MHNLDAIDINCHRLEAFIRASHYSPQASLFCHRCPPIHVACMEFWVERDCLVTNRGDSEKYVEPNHDSEVAAG
jgi:hypothetical protein